MPISYPYPSPGSQPSRHESGVFWHAIYSTKLTVSSRQSTALLNTEGGVSIGLSPWQRAAFFDAQFLCITSGSALIQAGTAVLE